MRYVKYLALLSVLMVPLAYSQAQVSFGVGVGPGYVGGPPVCQYGYYDYYPYACVPYGYYGPNYFVDGLFIGVGPWAGYYGGGYYGRGYYGRGFYGRGYDRAYYGRGYGRGDNGRGYSGHGYQGRGPTTNFHGSTGGGGSHGSSSGGFHGGSGGGFHGGSGGGSHGGGSSHGGGGRR